MNPNSEALGGGEQVKEERKQRTVESLTREPPPYNRPRFHRAVDGAGARSNWRKVAALAASLPKNLGQNVLIDASKHE